MSYIKTAKEVLEIEAKALQDTASKIDDSFDKAVEAIYALKGKLVVMGVGKSGLVGAKIAATMASTGTPAFFIHPTEAMHGDLGMIGKDDGLLAISYSGESEELTAIVKHIRLRCNSVITMSGKQNSTLASLSCVNLDISVHKEACYLGAAPTSSTTLTMALGDALSVALMQKRDFKQEDFALFHPGGTLGKRLFVKVNDLMRKNSLPIVSCETLLKDAIPTMSNGKLGNLIFTDSENRIEAVLSDGDLRRALANEDFSINDKAIKYANKTPKYIDDSMMLAVDALRYVEDNKIQLLLVLDRDKKLQGVLHIHDLVSAGIK